MKLFVCMRTRRREEICAIISAFDENEAYGVLLSSGEEGDFDEWDISEVGSSEIPSLLWSYRKAI